MGRMTFSECALSTLQHGRAPDHDQTLHGGHLDALQLWSGFLFLTRKQQGFHFFYFPSSFFGKQGFIKIQK
jgi:hypothetical protein